MEKVAPKYSPASKGRVEYRSVFQSRIPELLVKVQIPGFTKLLNEN